MKKPINIKKLILPNLPYLFFTLIGTIVGKAIRMTGGSNASEMLLNFIRELLQPSSRRYRVSIL